MWHDRKRPSSDVVASFIIHPTCDCNSWFCSVGATFALSQLQAPAGQRNGLTTYSTPEYLIISRSMNGHSSWCCCGCRVTSWILSVRPLLKSVLVLTARPAVAAVQMHRWSALTLHGCSLLQPTGSIYKSVSSIKAHSANLLFSLALTTKRLICDSVMHV